MLRLFGSPCYVGRLGDGYLVRSRSKWGKQEHDCGTWDGGERPRGDESFSYIVRSCVLFIRLRALGWAGFGKGATAFRSYNVTTGCRAIMNAQQEHLSRLAGKNARHRSCDDDVDTHDTGASVRQ
nr:hypothetical protein CFP56_11884 [Quercus suber]